jgi:hypothetical protein
VGRGQPQQVLGHPVQQPTAHVRGSVHDHRCACVAVDVRSRRTDRSRKSATGAPHTATPCHQERQVIRASERPHVRGRTRWSRYQTLLCVTTWDKARAKRCNRVDGVAPAKGMDGVAPAKEINVVAPANCIDGVAPARGFDDVAPTKCAACAALQHRCSVYGHVRKAQEAHR